MRWTERRRLAGAGLLVAAALGALAGAVRADSGAAAAWRAAPLWGADVRSLVVHPEHPDTLFAGTSSGQVYLSSDGGEQWRPAGAHLPFPGWVVSALAFDPNRPGRLWAGLRGMWGDGLVSVSDDLGESWLPRVGDLPDLPIYSLALVPGVEGRLYAGTLDGVWGSDDGGDTWRHLTAAIPEVAKVASLLVPEGEPATVIAGTWRRAYKSVDGGRTWRGVFEGMFLDSEVFALIPTGRTGEVWAPTCNWVYQSLDGGESWRRFQTGMDERRATAFGAVPWGRLLSGTVAGLYVSDDQGRNWRRTTSPGLSIHTLAAHPGRPARVFLGTEGSGVWVSNDGGDTVRPSSVGMTNLRAADVAAAGGELFVAVNHAGPASGIYVSTDGGRSFPGRAEGLPTILDLAALEAPGGGVRVWAATERGLLERREGRWTRVEAFGEARVEEVLARDGRVVVRTSDRVWELVSGEPAGGKAGAERFVETPYHHGPPRSATLRGGELWVTDAAGLYRVADGSNHTVAAPYPAGRVASLGDRLLYSGSDGAWTRAGAAEPWVPLASGHARVLATGDLRFPALLFEEGGRVGLLSAEGALRELELPIPKRNVAAALVHGGRLYLATSGFGLLSTELPPDEPVVEAP
ncbi:MAG TPA: hypothetical protein VM599_02335 [Thermoanaerobaculia bacterium]|nr:hypothetical protein [Thermoanaerobaculia bacterium]